MAYWPPPMKNNVGTAFANHKRNCLRQIEKYLQILFLCFFEEKEVKKKKCRVCENPAFFIFTTFMQAVM